MNDAWVIELSVFGRTKEQMNDLLGTVFDLAVDADAAVGVGTYRALTAEERAEIEAVDI